MKNWKYRDLVQNISIVLLSLTAVFLFTRTQLYTLGMDAGDSYFQYLTGGSDQTSTAGETALTGLTAPVRTAVTGVYGGRFGSVTLTTTDESFEPVGGLLREALRSAQDFSPCESREFLKALEGTSVYCDFLEPLPLSVLAGLVGAAVDSGLTARQVLIVPDGTEGTLLYLWDEGADCRRAVSAVSPEELDSVVGSYELNGASFAMDSPEPDAAGIAPCSLFPPSIPALPVFTSSTVLPDSSALLAALGFYPRTNSRYTESGGVEVITDGDRTLRISPDGSIRYRSGGDPALTIAAAGETPTVTEAVMGASTLLNALLPAQTGGAGLYLRGVRQGETTATLSFGWQIGGVPIRFTGGGSAGEVTLTGTAVTALSLCFRQYTDTGEMSLLLPLRQALAIAAGQRRGAELSIGYVDDGVTARVGWLSD